MSTISAFQGAKAAAMASLDPQKPFEYITSISNFAQSAIGHRAGVVFPARRDVAAHMIAQGTHRLSTPEEIAEYVADEKRKQAEHERNRPIPMTLDSIAQVARAAQGTDPTNATPAKGGK